MNSSDPSGELTQGQIHDLVLDEIIKKKKKEGRNSLTMEDTCIYYNCVDFWGGWGFCDLYDTVTGEVWELKKASTSYTCTTTYASNQLKNYVSGRLKANLSMPLSQGGHLLDGKSTFTYSDHSGTYYFLYWEEGNGILRYAYFYQKNKSQAVYDAACLLLCAGIPSYSRGGGHAKVIAFSDDLQDVA